VSKSDLAKITVAIAILALAVLLTVRFWRSDDGVSDQAFFYDLSAGKLFTANRTRVPPIPGVDNQEEDAARAVVISTTGRPEDKSSWKIAYLERYSPELKRQMEEAQRTGGSPSMSRSQALAHRYVRRLADPEWVPMNSPEAELIVTEWATPTESGAIPVICAP
jgi:hypothetical protein